jgi:MFS transporter, FHS family, L-fucose permease
MNNSRASIFKSADGRDFTVTFFLISSLFFLWGVCNGMIDVMDKHFQDHLHLSKARSAWIQFAHYIGYFIMAMPAGILASKMGYKGAIVCGLLTVSGGGFWFIAATHIGLFWAFLLGVCVIAAGLTILETVANPYATVLGSSHYAAARINLAQSFNAIGWILGPIIGGAFFYSSRGDEVAQQQLYLPYTAIAVVVLALAALFFFAHVPEIKPDNTVAGAPSGEELPRSLWQRPHFIGAVLAQFLYVAAQAGIFSFFINYMVEELPPLSPSIANNSLLKGGIVLREHAYHLSDRGASRLQGAVAFLLFCIGRFVGSSILRKVQAHRLLGVYGAINAILCGLVALKLGWVSVFAVFLSFFFMSIMFPTIFALGLRGLGGDTKKASAFIVMAIVGGAVMPKLMGYLGDIYDMSKAFLMPLGCFLLISIYGYCWQELFGERIGPENQGSG